MDRDIRKGFPPDDPVSGINYLPDTYGFLIMIR